jgi:F0F1-type ATP synthase assembly protein I
MAHSTTDSSLVANGTDAGSAEHPLSPAEAPISAARALRREETAGHSEETAAPASADEAPSSGSATARGSEEQQPLLQLKTPEMAEIAINDLAVEARDAFAEAYFKKDLADQRAWYSQKAGLFKQRAELLALLTIMLGALITFIQVFGQAPWVPIVSGLIGAIVAVAAAWQRIARYQETWISYRTASERMKSECRVVTHGAGSYRGLAAHDARIAFVEAIDRIIAEEQNIFWRDRSNNPPPQPGTRDPQIVGEPGGTQVSK